MLSRIEQRKRAYEFVYQKAKELEAKGNYGIDKYIEETDIVYLEDLDKLKRGIADPSNELILILKKSSVPLFIKPLFNVAITGLPPCWS